MEHNHFDIKSWIKSMLEEIEVNCEDHSFSGISNIKMAYISEHLVMANEHIKSLRKIN